MIKRFSHLLLAKPCKTRKEPCKATMQLQERCSGSELLTINVSISFACLSPFSDARSSHFLASGRFLSTPCPVAYMIPTIDWASIPPAFRRPVLLGQRDTLLPKSTCRRCALFPRLGEGKAPLRSTAFCCKRRCLCCKPLLPSGYNSEAR